MKSAIEDLSEKVDRNQAILARTHILRFDDELLNDIKHSREYFAQQLQDIDTRLIVKNIHISRTLMRQLQSLTFAQRIRNFLISMKFERRKTMSKRMYDVLKYVAQIVLPALATFYFAIAQIWNLPYAEEIVGTISALDVLLGALLGISSRAYFKEQEEHIT